MKKDKLKSILTSKVAVGVIGFALGGMILGGTSGIDITKERYDQLLEMEKKVIGESNENSDVADAAESDDKDKNKGKEESKENTVYEVGQTAYIENSKGVKEFSLTINSAKLIDKRNQFSDKKADKVVEIEYTYENINLEENLNIFDSHFKVYDKSGNALESYPAGSDKHSQAISKDKKCTATMSFALNNESNDIELEFYKNMFDNKATAKFKAVAQ